MNVHFLSLFGTITRYVAVILLRLLLQEKIGEVQYGSNVKAHQLKDFYFFGFFKVLVDSVAICI